MQKVANAFAKLSKCQQFTTDKKLLILYKKLQTLLQSYQNVSNSQHLCLHLLKLYCCKRFCKVIKMLAIHNNFLFTLSESKVANAFAKLSKCQQFTTISFFTISFMSLQTLLQSYQNVSNSQLVVSLKEIKICCKRFCKVIKMLAIHNKALLYCQKVTVANAFAKLSKCYQFTTINDYSLQFIRLQTLLQSYQNVSNSQLL